MSFLKKGEWKKRPKSIANVGDIQRKGKGTNPSEAISNALDFAKLNGNTLIVVTADHETGGLAIKKGNLKKNSVLGDFTTIGHSGTMVPVFSYGSKSEIFKGIYENTAIFNKLKIAADQ